MAYWTLTKDCLFRLKDNWNRFYNERLEAINYLAKCSEEDYRYEGNNDIRYGRYSTRSVHEWYDDKIYQLKQWVNECIATLEEEDRKFNRLWDQAWNDYYDSRDYHYVVIYDFYRFEKRKEYAPDLDSSHFRVRFSGKTHWYKHRDRRRDLEFFTSTPEFDRHDY